LKTLILDLYHVDPDRPDAPAPIPWLLGRDGVVLAEGRLDMAATLPGLAEPGVERVLALVPGTEVVAHRLTIPAKGEEKARAAAPYLLEDDLAVEVEQAHVALGPPQADGRRAALVADRTRVDAWRRLLLPLDRAQVLLVPDMLALDVPADRLRLLGRPGGLLAAGGPLGGVAAEADLLPWLLPPHLDGVTLVSLETGLPAPAGGWGERRVEPGPVLDGSGFLRAVLEAATRRPPPSLFQGPLTLPRRGVRTGRAWARVAVLAGLAALLHLAGLGLDGWRLSARAAALEQRAEALFRQTFPDATRIVNLSAQTRARLAGLQQTGRDSYALLTGLLFDAAAGLPGLSLEGLRYDGDRRELAADLTYGSYTEMEDLRTAVASRGGRLAEGAARQEAGRTVAAITVTLP